MAVKDFSAQDDFILNYRPTIEFVEPEQVEVGPSEETPPPVLDTARTQTQQIVDGLNKVATLADAVQKRIDQRVQSAGGLTVKLDPLKDVAAISAMKRLYPDRVDPTLITYDDYRRALDCLQVASATPLKISPDDVLAAQADPLRTDFGGFSNQQGENRSELSSGANSIKPIDLEQYQKDAVLSLFSMMKPLITGEIAKQIAKAIGF